MAPARLSRLQRRILVWLAAEAQRTRGTMAADHRELVRALGHDKGNLSTSLKNLAAKGLVTITRTPGGQAEAVDLTAEGYTRAEVVNNPVVHKGTPTGQPVYRVCVDIPEEEYAALEEHAGRRLRRPDTMLRVLLRQWLFVLTRGAVGGDHPWDGPPP
jgi:DNA-binding MarR family transcriptional regulator